MSETPTAEKDGACPECGLPDDYCRCGLVLDEMRSSYALKVRDFAIETWVNSKAHEWAISEPPKWSGDLADVGVSRGYKQAQSAPSSGSSRGAKYRSGPRHPARPRSRGPRRAAGGAGMNVQVVDGRAVKIEETIYLGRWLDTGEEAWFIWSGRRWIEHPRDVDCPDCMARVEPQQGEQGAGDHE